MYAQCVHVGTLYIAVDYTRTVWITECTESGDGLAYVHSIMMEKSTLPGDGGGCTPTPFHCIYHHIQSCSVRSSWEGRYTPPISTLPLYLLCGVDDRSTPVPPLPYINRNSKPKKLPSPPSNFDQLIILAFLDDSSSHGSLSFSMASRVYQTKTKKGIIWKDEYEIDLLILSGKYLFITIWLQRKEYLYVINLPQ